MSRIPNSRPAVLGGAPVRPAGPPDWPIADDDVRQALEAAYRDGSWGRYHGAYLEQLEQELARYHALPQALACSSGTFAVELALRALRVGPGDEVILAAYDYGGNFLSVLAVGAQPVLVDVDPGNWNLAPAAVAEAIGPRTRAVIASHLHGGVVPMRELTEIAARHGLAVVEDAAQMPGATVQGRRAGTWGDVGTLSFGGSKLLTAGRGGAILTARRDLHHRARLACQRGNNNAYPLSELQAAVLLPQLAKLDLRNQLRTRNARLLTDRLGAAAAGLQPLVNRAADTTPGYYKLGFQYDPSRFAGLSRDRFAEAVCAEGVALDAGFRSLHVGRSPRRYRRAGDLAQAERAHHLMLVLHHPVLLGAEAEIGEVVEAVRKVHAHAPELADLPPARARAVPPQASGGVHPRRGKPGGSPR